MVRLIALTLTLLLFLLLTAASATRVLCLYYSAVDLTLRNCSLFRQTAEAFFADDVEFEYAPYSPFRLAENVDVVYLSGFGTLEGFWEDAQGRSVVPWCELIQRIRAPVVLIDACYSGEVATCDLDGKVVLTSTGRQAASFNLPLTSAWGNVSTFAAALYCLTHQDHPDCAPKVGCVVGDPQLCHLGFLIDAFTGYRNIEDKLRRTDLHPDLQIGVIHLNGQPLRNWFK